jgi:hypothetical protein
LIVATPPARMKVVPLAAAITIGVLITIWLEVIDRASIVSSDISLLSDAAAAVSVSRHYGFKAKTVMVGFPPPISGAIWL